MTVLPLNNTTRWFLDYSVAGHEHTTTFRTVVGATDLEVQNLIHDLVLSLADNVALTTLIGLRVSAKGTNFSVPVSTAGIPATWGTGAGTDQTSAAYLSFIGRDSVGKRGRITFFGFSHLASAVNFRAVPGEISQVGTSVAILNAASPPVVTISENAPTWYNYWDVGTNAYWRNRLR